MRTELLKRLSALTKELTQCDRVNLDTVAPGKQSATALAARVAYALTASGRLVLAANLLHRRASRTALGGAFGGGRSRSRSGTTLEELIHADRIRG